MNGRNKQHRPDGGNAAVGGDRSSSGGDRKIGGQGDGGNYGFDRHARGIPIGPHDSSSRRGAGKRPNPGGSGSQDEAGGRYRSRGDSIGAGAQKRSSGQSAGERALEPADHSASEDWYKKSSEVVSQWRGRFRDQGGPSGRSRSSAPSSPQSGMGSSAGDGAAMSGQVNDSSPPSVMNNKSLSGNSGGSGDKGDAERTLSRSK